VGVEPEAGNDGQQSLRAGHIIEIPVPRSIADGTLTAHLGKHNFPLIQRHVDVAAPASIGDVLKGLHSGRSNDEAITVFDSSGIALQDLYLGAHLLKAAEGN
jgi:ornithine cyclodeaminase/alanine dehydrogenase-like protein (mu-crystallin family)